MKDFAIASNPIYSNNFLSLAPFFNIYGDKNQEQGKLFITYIAPASNYDVSIESKVYSLNGKKYKEAIYSIVTKEQFESMEYRLGDDK